MDAKQWVCAEAMTYLKKTISFFVVLECVLILSGCTTAYAPTEASPRRALESLPQVHRNGAFSMGAEAYQDLERQEAVFDARLTEAGILPVLVVVENHGEEEVLVRRSDIRLKIPGGRSIANASMNAVATRYRAPGSDYFWSEFFLGFAGAFIVDNSAEKSIAERKADYQAKGFSDVYLAPGEGASGFVFFVPAKGTAVFNSAEVRVRFVDKNFASSELLSLEIKTSGLKIPAVKK